MGVGMRKALLVVPTSRPPLAIPCGVVDLGKRGNDGRIAEGDERCGPPSLGG
jgi:hypothetical protein